MKLIDSHCHVSFNEYRDDADAIIRRALENKVQMVNVGTNLKTSIRAVETAEKYDGMWASIGLHPIHLAKDITETATFGDKKYSFSTKAEKFDKRTFFKLAQHPKVVAIGESGLDYYHLDDFKADVMTAQEFIALQKETLHEIMSFAREVQKPIIFHCRDAYDDLIDILHDFGEVTGVVHCFTGTLAQAKQFLELGLSIGFTGIVTFPNAKSLQEIAQATPLNRILLETDAPFLAPEPVRGQRNEPLYVQHVAEKIAQLQSISIDEVAKQTTQNTRTLFHLYSK
ncbi:MAG TPA: TatD family hydrolase [Patescibacteria group bacterium]|nr:TatD family hydrolase [Patescibacteria group bacterium]